MKLNQKGITLVELLAALALVSIIAAGAWTALSIGLEHSAVETNKTKMQLDANLIVTTLSNAHRQSEEYSVWIDDGYLMLQRCPSAPPCNEPFEKIIDRKYFYTGTKINDVPYLGGKKTLKPKERHTDLELWLRLTPDKKPITINTSLTRILTD